MKAAIPFSTTPRHQYLYSSYNKQFLLSHPLINYFAGLQGAVKSPERIKNKAGKSQLVRIPGLGNYCLS